jgi:hypothetical protein
MRRDRWRNICFAKPLDKNGRVHPAVPPRYFKENNMEALNIAAQFAAYTWFENSHKDGANEAAKARFTKENWKRFMPIAHEGLGQLLIKIGAGPAKERHVRKPRSKMKLAAAG